MAIALMGSSYETGTTTANAQSSLTVQNIEALATPTPKEPLACSGGGTCTMGGRKYEQIGLFGGFGNNGSQH